MIKFFFIGLFLFLQQGLAQTVKLTLSVPINAKAADIDLAGNAYVLDERYNFVLFKRSADTAQIISLANYGGDAIIDASNELEVFVFFPQNGVGLWFDNQLNNLGKINFFDFGITQPIAAGRSNDGMIWVYDNNSRTLKKLSKQGVLIDESQILNQFISKEKALKIMDNGKWILIQDANDQTFRFEQNLIMKETNSLKGRVVDLTDNGAVVVDSNAIENVVFDFASTQYGVMAVLPNYVKFLAFKHERFLLTTNVGVDLYEISQP
jgi:hypothetical protein